MKILIFNQKGGVGKTTTALNLGVGLARFGELPVTLVDLDQQTHLTAALGYRTENFTWNVSDWLAGKIGSPQQVDERLSLIVGDANPPLNLDLSETVLNSKGVVIIDAPPVWNATVAHLMQRVDWILTPLEPEFMSMQGISRLLETMEKNHISWQKLRLLLCRFDNRLVTHRQMRESLSQRFNEHLLRGVIRNNIRLAEAPAYSRSIFDYAPDSSGANDYYALTHYWLHFLNSK
jgi:chromosome partitioning protein